VSLNIVEMKDKRVKRLAAGFVAANDFVTALQIERARVVGSSCVADNHGTTNCAFFFSDGFEDHFRSDAGRVSIVIPTRGRCAMD
jgi:hypothetical protein